MPNHTQSKEQVLVDSFLNALANGLSLGSLYAVLALGFVVIYRATGVLNFAHGAFLLSGVFVAAVVSDSHGYLLGVIAGLTVGGVVAIITDVVFMRNSRTRDHVTLTILTLGVNLLVVTELSRRLGSETLPLNDPMGDTIVQLGMVTIPASRLIALGVAVTAIVVFLLLFRFTNWGLAMRVSNQDPEVAALMGVRLSRVSWTSWAIGGALAVLAGLFLASFPTAGVTPALSDTAFRAFPAAVIGGLGSVTGALVGGMMLGLTEAFFATYESMLGPWAHNLSGISAWILLLVVLVLRPGGIFSTKQVARV